KKVELPRLSRLHPENLGLIGIAVDRSNPASRAVQFLTFDFNAAGLEFFLDHLSRPDQVERSASAGADAERLSGYGILWHVKFGSAGAVFCKPAQRDHQTDVNYFTHS